MDNELYFNNSGIFIKNANFKVLITKLKKNILREHDLFKDNFYHGFTVVKNPPVLGFVSG